MAVLLEKMTESYNYIFYDLADERTRDMHLSLPVMIMTMAFYLYFTKSLGPRLMSDIKPFKLRTTIFYYNLFQIFICIYIIYLGIKGGWFNGYSLSCQPIDWTDNPQSRYMINGVWWYVTVKLIDLLDTVFFVLRKKDRQISFLHVFHHFMMPLGSYYGMKYYPTGHGTLLGLLNCVVHIFMYGYYLIAGLGPKYQKYLWWKKYITLMQLVQFGIVFVHGMVALCDSTCGYPKWILCLICLQSIHFTYMFGAFYYANYIKKPKSIANGTAKIKN